MTRFPLAALALLLLAGCQGGADTGTLTPAHAVLFGCDAFATALDNINKPDTFKKINDATLKLVVEARDSVKPLCTGPAPDINSSVSDTAIDSGVRVLNAVLTNL
jgi:hypothetical protein